MNESTLSYKHVISALDSFAIHSSIRGKNRNSFLQSIGLLCRKPINILIWSWALLLQDLLSLLYQCPWCLAEKHLKSWKGLRWCAMWSCQSKCFNRLFFYYSFQYAYARYPFNDVWCLFYLKWHEWLTILFGNMCMKVCVPNYLVVQSHFPGQIWFTYKI